MFDMYYGRRRRIRESWRDYLIFWDSECLRELEMSYEKML